jgi:hypothetical protein
MGSSCRKKSVTTYDSFVCLFSKGARDMVRHDDGANTHIRVPHRGRKTMNLLRTSLYSLFFLSLFAFVSTILMIDCSRLARLTRSLSRSGFMIKIKTKAKRWINREFSV